jgi:non-ribosomal peptide synthetase component F
MLPTYAGDRQAMRMAPALQQALTTLGAQLGCSLLMILLAAFQVLLHRLTGQDDIVVGIAAAEPTAASATNLLGYTTSLLPLRSRIDHLLKFSDYLSTVKQTVFDAYAHQCYSLNRLIEQLDLHPEPGRPPVVSTVFNVDYGGTTPALYGLEVEMFAPASGAVECDLFWNVTATDNGLLVDCYYNTDLFEAESIRRWLGYYQSVLTAVASDPSLWLSHVPLLWAAEPQRRLGEHNDTEADRGRQLSAEMPE